METIMLNKEQEEVYQRLVSFMVGPESSIILDGSGGTGKSYLIEHFVRNIDRDTDNLCKLLGLKHNLSLVYLTATTNKAVENLASNTTYPVETIHSLLGLTVVNTTSGETKLEKTSKMKFVSANQKTGYTTVIIIDECSMIDKNLFNHIKESCANCKVIYVGDWCQLPPVKESISPIYTQGYSLLELHKIMRTSEKELYDLNKAVKSLVIDSKPITITTGSRIKKLNDKEAIDYINNNFNDVKNDNLIVSYTNLNSIQYSKYIQQLRGNTDFLTLNSRYVCNNAVHDGNGSLIVKTEEELTLTFLGDSKYLPKDYYPEDILYRVCTFTDKFGNTKGLRVFEDPEDYKKVLNFLRKNKDWKKFYTIKDYFGDLRNRDSCTVHKSQGSTVNDVFIDLEDLMKCRQPDMVRRLLYVAISRARNNVYFYGDLKEKYGVIL